MEVENPTKMASSQTVAGGDGPNIKKLSRANSGISALFESKDCSIDCSLGDRERPRSVLNNDGERNPPPQLRAGLQVGPQRMLEDLQGDPHAVSFLATVHSIDGIDMMTQTWCGDVTLHLFWWESELIKRSDGIEKGTIYLRREDVNVPEPIYGRMRTARRRYAWASHGSSCAKTTRQASCTTRRGFGLFCLRCSSSMSFRLIHKLSR